MLTSRALAARLPLASVLAMALVSAGPVVAQPPCSARLFGSDNDLDRMLLIDPATGEAEILAPFNFGAVVSSALSLDAQGTLWGSFSKRVG